MFTIVIKSWKMRLVNEWKELHDLRLLLINLKISQLQRIFSNQDIHAMADNQRRWSAPTKCQRVVNKSQNLPDRMFDFVRQRHHQTNWIPCRAASIVISIDSSITNFSITLLRHDLPPSLSWRWMLPPLSRSVLAILYYLQSPCIDEFYQVWIPILVAIETSLLNLVASY